MSSACSHGSYDDLVAALDLIGAEADDKAALSTEQRQKAEAEAMSDLLAVERDEAALVWRAMDEKLPVEFRADTNPLAILQVRLLRGQTVICPRRRWDCLRPRRPGGGRRR